MESSAQKSSNDIFISLERNLAAKSVYKSDKPTPEIKINISDTNSKKLVVILGFSKYMFKGYKDNNLQFIGDWYLDNIYENIMFLAEYIIQHDIEQIDFIGTSKSCMGAFIFSHELAPVFPDVDFRVFAFSAYTTLDKSFYEANSITYLPKSLFQIWDNPSHKEMINTYGEINKLINNRNILTYLLYPEQSRGGESILANLLTDKPNVTLIPVTARTHSIIFPFWSKLSPSMEIEVFEGVVKQLPKDVYKYFSAMQSCQDYNFHIYSLINDTKNFIKQIELFNERYRPD